MARTKYSVSVTIETENEICEEITRSNSLKRGKEDFNNQLLLRAHLFGFPRRLQRDTTPLAFSRCTVQHRRTRPYLGAFCPPCASEFI